MIYCDFSKGFDVVPHRRLLAKCDGLGIRGKVLWWVKEWLTDRKQIVDLNGKASDWGDVMSSLVQYSCLGPCLERRTSGRHTKWEATFLSQADKRKT